MTRSQAMEGSFDRDEHITSLLETALASPVAERRNYLLSACEGDGDLFEEVTETLDWERRMGRFLLEPVIQFIDFVRPFQAGQTISGRFEIVREIGEGGMGIVYEAFDRKRNQRIAIKSARPGFQRWLSPELESALSVRHPNICLVNEIHTAQTEQGEIDFLTMEFLEGETLYSRLCRCETLDPEPAIEIARQLCEALAEAHRSGIIHGDLKSSNVFLCTNPNGTIRSVITDFGLARTTAAQDRESAGTPGYIAPEIWQGDQLSKASDLYALGVILYEMVVGGRPRPDIPPFQDEPVIRPSVQRKGLDPRWDRAILPCLEPSKERRTADPLRILAAFDRRHLRKGRLALIVATVAAVFGSAALVPSFRRSVTEFFRPPSVRLAVLPLQSQSEANSLPAGAMQEVSDRLRELPSQKRTVVIIPPVVALKNGVESPQQARQILHATHALQTSVRREGNTWVAQGAVIDLETHVRLHEFSGQYSTENIAAMPTALSGAVCLALSLHCSSSPEVPAAAASDPYFRGLYLLRANNQRFAESVPLFEQAARLDSRSPLPLAALAEVYTIKFKATRDRSFIEKAKNYLRAAETLNPDSPRVRLASGLLNETTGQYEQALQEYRRVQELEPRNVDALLRVAGVYDKLESPEKAVQAYREAIQVDPAYYEPYEDLGEFYYYRGQYAEAAAQFQQTFERAPGMVDAYTNFAAAMSDLGRDADAERALIQSLKIRESARALNSLGAIRAYQRRDLEAAKYYRRALRLDSSTYIYWLNLGDSERRLKAVAEARSAYERAQELTMSELRDDPRSGYTRAFAAYFAARLGDPRRAEDEISQALELSPGDNKVIRRAVLTYEVLGQREQAIKSLSGATPSLLRELARHPDLVDFSRDVRVKRLLRESLTEKK